MDHSAEVIPINIEDEMRGSYLDYAMSVIIGRALPDIRDGLKPAHRRILYAMYREGLLSNKRYSKCAGVVGEVLKKYHPHGDAAVYDTLVRMAQEWNLRYPLIDGQGNFGCFTADTKIRLAGGTSKSFDELVRDYSEGKTHFTYTIKGDGTIAMAPIRAPRLTKQDVPVVRVTLDSDEKITCTPDHRFLLRDNTYREARHLKPGDSLMPFYSRIYQGPDANLKGYEEVYNPAGDRWTFAHHLADAYNLAYCIYPRNAGRVRHHKDFNKLNNDPRNLVRMHWAEHRRLHMLFLKELWGSQEFQKKMKGVLTRLWRDPAFREKTILAIGNENRRRWRSAKFREKQLVAKRKLWCNPDFRCRILKAAMEKNILLHGRLNHSVVSVEPAGRADVYDLTVDDTHNFALAAGVFVHNSIDGDSAAAYRYTEARLKAIAEELLADIDESTVDFIPNFDGSTVEPTVLPSKIPNLLINGSDGIAVGMATKIPPHNLSEVVDGLIALMGKPDISVKELRSYIKGPDFPTGGFIHGMDGIKNAYETGRGSMQMRGRAMIEPMAKGDKECIVITEIPYQINKSKLIERIAELIGEGKLSGVADLRDESDRDGMRIVVELKRGTVAGVVMNQLYAQTPLQTSFGAILLAIVGGQPKIVNLKEALQLFMDHRKEVVIRRTAWRFKETEKRLHVLEGLKIAIESIDEVIALIKKSKEPSVAKTALMKEYKLSDVQAQAILEMRLQRLTGLEREKLVTEYDATKKLMKELKAILEDERLVMKIIVDELTEVKTKFGDARRTVIQAKTEELSVEDLIQEEEMVVTVSHRGYIKRNPISIYRAQRRGGKGKTGMAMREEDFVEDLFIASTHSYILIFSSSGKVFWLKVHELPQVGRVARGQPITSLIRMPSGDHVAAILPVRDFKEGQFVVMATKQGVIKKTELMAFSNPRPGGIIATTIDEEDELISAHLSSGHQEVLISTKEGQAIRFPETDVRAMGRSARGVRGISLGDKDEVVSMEVLSSDASILTVTENGYGKRTELAEHRVQSRGGRGIITIKVSDRNGPVVGVRQVTDADDIMLVTDGGKIIRSRAKEIPTIGRNTQGVRLISLDEGEKVVSVARLAEDEEEGENAGAQQ